MYVLSVVFGSVIKIEYHKSGQECLEQKLKEIKKIIVERAEFERYRFRYVGIHLSEIICSTIYIMMLRSNVRFKSQLIYEFEISYHHCTC